MGMIIIVSRIMQKSSFHLTVKYLVLRIVIMAVPPVKPRIFKENPNHCTIMIVPGSVAIAYRTSHR
jgi:hypothetical protein